MGKKSWQGSSIRTTITMNRGLYRDLRDLMKRQGWGGNFSAFMAEAARAQRSRMLRDERKLEGLK